MPAGTWSTECRLGHRSGVSRRTAGCGEGALVVVSVAPAGWAGQHLSEVGRDRGPELTRRLAMGGSDVWQREPVRRGWRCGPFPCPTAWGASGAVRIGRIEPGRPGLRSSG